MRFKEFKERVEEWASIRGIYEHSTEEHQQAKALEEIGEYITAKSTSERMDAVGDVAVCIVNAAHIDESEIVITRAEEPGEMCLVASLLLDSDYSNAIYQLKGVAMGDGYLFEDCLQMAWDEIKDRKGMMSNGMYVKWDNMSDEQKSEFMRRNGQ